MKTIWNSSFRWLILLLTLLLTPSVLMAAPCYAGPVNQLAPDESSANWLQKPSNFDLLIVTPAEFHPALRPLRDHKNADRHAGRDRHTGDDLPEFTGVDAPEQIKRAIEYYVRTNAVKYVMLVGDVNKFPVRWQFGTLVDKTVEQSGLADDYIHASADFYYADLYIGVGPSTVGIQMLMATLARSTQTP